MWRRMQDVCNEAYFLSNFWIYAALIVPVNSKIQSRKRQLVNCVVRIQFMLKTSNLRKNNDQSCEKNLPVHRNSEYGGLEGLFIAVASSGQIQQTTN